MKRSSLIAVAGVVFVWTLLMQAPAVWVYRAIQPHMPGFSLFGVDGHVGDGEASGFSLAGHNIDEHLHWSLQPWWLPLGRLAVRIDGSGLVQASGGVQYGIGGLRLRNLVGDGDAKAIGGLVGYGFAPVIGVAHFDIAALQLRGGVPVAADGSLEFHGLSWALSQNPVPLGDFRAAASTQNDAVVVKITSLAGPLDADGDLKFTPADGRYDVDLKLRPKDNADPVLRNMLQSIGPPDPNAFYHLRRNGTLQ